MSAWLLMLERFDKRAFHALVVRDVGLVHGGMKLVTRFADPSVAISLGLFLFLLPFNPDTFVAASATVTMAISHVLVQFLKRVASRPRPSIPPGLAAITDAPDRFSFPSGHAAASLSLALPLAVYFGGVPALLFLAFAGLVGASRCYLGLHYPGDVVGGWVLALCSYVAVYQGIDAIVLNV